MQLRVVHKPSAGTAAVDAAALQQSLAAGGHEIVGYHTVDDDWQQRLRPTDELLVVAGGDGTVRKVLLAAIGRCTPVAIVPTGTANNIARSLGLDVDDPLALPTTWSDPVPLLHFDVATVSGAEGAEPFVEGVGGGLFAETMRRADERAGNGQDVDVWTTLREVLRDETPGDWGIDVDGRDRSGRYLAAHVTNIAHAGRAIPIAPAARPDDGLLDLVLVTAGDREALDDYAARRHRGAEVAPPAATVITGRRITLEPPAGCTLAVDDANRTRGWFAPGPIRVEGATVGVPTVLGRNAVGSARSASRPMGDSRIRGDNLDVIGR